MRVTRSRFCDYRQEGLGARAASSGNASLIAHISSFYHARDRIITLSAMDSASV